MGKLPPGKKIYIISSVELNAYLLEWFTHHQLMKRCNFHLTLIFYCLSHFILCEIVDRISG